MKIIWDSTLHTWEGITHCSRQMAIQLHRRGHQLMLTDIAYKRTTDPTGEIAKMYNPIDVVEDDYIYVKNSAPDMIPHIQVKKMACYAVMEGDRIPKSWVIGMNTPQVKRVLTPSQYCKTMFENSGVTTPIDIVPHGIDTSVFYPDKTSTPSKLSNGLENKYKIFGAGAIYGLTTKDRKGFDYLLQGMGKAFKDNSDVCLVLKINTMYADAVYAAKGMKFDLNNWLASMLPSGFKPEIRVVASNLDNAGMRQLYNFVDCGIFPSRGEGYNLIGNEMLACGTPIILTGASGHLEYANKNNSLLIDIEGTEPGERRYPYFDEPTFNEDKEKGMIRSESFYQSQWYKVSVDSLVKQMLWAYKHQDEHKQMATDNLPNIRKNQTWDVVGKQLNTILEEVMNK